MSVINAEEMFKELDVRCYQCKGDGKIWLSCGQCSRECDVCYSTGYLPTGAGIELLNFLRRQKKRIERERV